MRLRKIRLREVSELEPFLIRQLSEVEEGLELLQNQLGIGEPGRPDIIAMDADGGLVLIELKSDPASIGALLQALRYHDCLTENRLLLARVYPRLKPDRAVRVFIAAPDFDDEIARLASYLSIPITFVRAEAVRDEDTGQFALMVATEEVEQRQETQGHLYSVQDIIDYLNDPEVKAEFEKVLADLRALGTAIRPYRAGRYRWLEFLYRGEEIAYLGTLQKAFKTQHYDPEIDDWPKPLVIETYAEWEQKSRPWIVSQIKATDEGK